MRHVGNAVPPLLARALRDQIAKDLIAANAHRLGGIIGRPKLPLRQETPEQRSRVMRQVPSKNTSVEIVFRKALWAHGIRGFRLHDTALPGHPDVVFPKRKVAVFVDGCFWHGCPKCYREPSSNKEYWTMKVQRNRNRDQRVTDLCKEQGWVVMRFWEHQVLTKSDKLANKLLELFAKQDRKVVPVRIKHKPIRSKRKRLAS
jgi:DNA mismatch endonuclease Vsr